jgi:hypothetical protein
MTETVDREVVVPTASACIDRIVHRCGCGMEVQRVMYETIHHRRDRFCRECGARLDWNEMK